MKIVFVLWSLISLNALADEKLICSLRYSKEVIATAKKHSQYDKNRHCSVSCMLTLTCRPSEVLLIGFLKEFKDFFGPGEADREDLKADRLGVDLARHHMASTQAECLEQCDLYYAPDLF